MVGFACHESALLLLISELSPQHREIGSSMSRFQKLTHVLWHCQYHIVWVPKYRFRVLKGAIQTEVLNSIQVYCSQLSCQIVEVNIQADHVHLLVKVPPKLSISSGAKLLYPTPLCYQWSSLVGPLKWLGQPGIKKLNKVQHT